MNPNKIFKKGETTTTTKFFNCYPTPSIHVQLESLHSCSARMPLRKTCARGFLIFFEGYRKRMFSYQGLRMPDIPCFYINT